MEGDDADDVMYKKQTEISIHALRVEGDKLAAFLNKMLEISIHALRVEGDSCVRASLLMFIVISIHALRVEGDYIR